MFTTDTTVYPCEQNQNRYENELNRCEHIHIYVPEIWLV